MNIVMGNQIFEGVEVPLLWGTRAVLQDRKNRLSVIDLGGPSARLEIVGDAAASGVPYAPLVGGFSILLEGNKRYSYYPREKRLSSPDFGLPDCQVAADAIRVGTSEFVGNMFSGFGVGIAVTRESISVGAPLPRGLAELVVPD